MNSTTPMKMHSGDSQDKSNENTTILKPWPANAARLGLP